jgi:RNA polymerase subunit RPABC4/transcription elongation factor Spt4
MEGHIESISLHEAAMCLNCPTIFNLRNRACPACASQAMHPVESWLGNVSAPSTKEESKHVVS